MGMGLGGCGIGDHENLDNMGVREDEAGKIYKYVSGRPIYTHRQWRVPVGS